MNWIHAGAHRAEAGYFDPALGWVSVRAEAASGGIHAAVMPGSAEAAQVLGGHMTGLSSHLAQQHGDTATVTLASAQDGAGRLGWGSQAGGGDRGTERHFAGAERNAADRIDRCAGASRAHGIRRNDHQFARSRKIRKHHFRDGLTGRAGDKQPRAVESGRKKCQHRQYWNQGMAGANPLTYAKPMSSAQGNGAVRATELRFQPMIFLRCW